MDRVKNRFPIDLTMLLFERLESIYKDRWIASYGNPKHKDIYINQWSTGLSGLTFDEIKKALDICRYNENESIPHVVEFYHYAKGIKYIRPKKSNLSIKINKDFGKSQLNSIRNSLKNNSLRAGSST